MPSNSLGFEAFSGAFLTTQGYFISENFVSSALPPSHPYVHVTLAPSWLRRSYDPKEQSSFARYQNVIKHLMQNAKSDNMRDDVLPVVPPKKITPEPGVRPLDPLIVLTTWIAS